MESRTLTVEAAPDVKSANIRIGEPSTRDVGDQAKGDGVVAAGDKGIDLAGDPAR